MAFLLLLACTPAVTPPVPPPRASEPEVETIPGVTDTADTGETGAGDTGPAWVPGAHLPVLLVDAVGAIPDGRKIDATLQVIEEHDGTLQDLTAAPRTHEGAVGIEIHGSSSTSYPKLGYRFECRDDAGEDTHCDLLGLGAGSDWVLHAPYSDKTYMRNALAYTLGREAALDRGAWEPGTRFVELVLDGEYVGLYVLVDRVSREEARLDLPHTTDPVTGAVDGGFIVKVDQHRSDGFDTQMGTPIDWSDPKVHELTREERLYIRDWFDRVETALVADDWADPVAGYAAWIDADGWIDHWLLNELAHNIDAYRLSAYLWTDGPPGEALLHAGPLWDFDRAFGNVDYCESWTTDGWIYDSLDRCGYAYQYPFWWERLREDPAFLARTRARWDELRAGALSDDTIVATIAELRAQTAEAEARDHAKWPVIGTVVSPNYYVGATWDEEIAWLQAWVLERAAWMDVHVGE